MKKLILLFMVGACVFLVATNFNSIFDFMLNKTTDFIISFTNEKVVLEEKFEEDEDFIFYVGDTVDLEDYFSLTTESGYLDIYDFVNMEVDTTVSGVYNIQFTVEESGGDGNGHKYFQSDVYPFTVLDTVDLLMQYNVTYFIGNELPDLTKCFVLRVNKQFVEVSEQMLTSNVDYENVGVYSVSCYYMSEDGQEFSASAKVVVTKEGETVLDDELDGYYTDGNITFVLSETLTFVRDNEFDVANLILIYDGNTLINPSKYVIDSEIDFTTAGTYSVTAYYSGKTCQFEVTIIDGPVKINDTDLADIKENVLTKISIFSNYANVTTNYVNVTTKVSEGGDEMLNENGEWVLSSAGDIVIDSIGLGHGSFYINYFYDSTDNDDSDLVTLAFIYNFLVIHIFQSSNMGRTHVVNIYDIGLERIKYNEIINSADSTDDEISEAKVLLQYYEWMYTSGFQREIYGFGYDDDGGVAFAHMKDFNSTYDFEDFFYYFVDNFVDPDLVWTLPFEKFTFEGIWVD